MHPKETLPHIRGILVMEARFLQANLLCIPIQAKGFIPLRLR